MKITGPGLLQTSCTNQRCQLSGGEKLAEKAL